MLTDIFAYRYAKKEIWDSYQDSHRRLLVQAFRILAEDVCPFYSNGKESERGKTFWTELHILLSRELGVKELSPTAYAYYTPWQGNQHLVSGIYPIITVCETWMLREFDNLIPADRFIKERLSLIELGFRKRGDEIADANQKLPAVVQAEKTRAYLFPGKIRVPGDPGEGLIAWNATINLTFQANINELNERFRQAGCDINYHNGFIQCTSDGLIEEKVEKPFWALVADPKMEERRSRHQGSNRSA
jgi:hypothetical protein